MNTEFLRTFIAVVDQGSFSRAEDKLFLSKQAIMQQINQLEHETGIQLIERGRRGTAPTEAGKAFYHGARQVLEAEKKMIGETQAAAGLSRQIRLSNVDYHVMLDPVTALFASRYPAVRIQKIFHPNTLEAQLVAQNIIDVGDTLYNPKYTENGLCYLPVMKMPYYCILPSEIEEDEINFEYLKDKSVVVHDREFRDYYSFHLDLLKAQLPGLQIISSRERRVDVIVRAVQEGNIVITASTFVKQIEGLILKKLDTGFRQECGIVYRENPSEEVTDYLKVAGEVYPE